MSTGSLTAEKADMFEEDNIEAVLLYTYDAADE